MFALSISYGQYTAIPDANFEQALFDQDIDTIYGDHRVLTSAINELTSLDISDFFNIKDLTGLQGFVSLRNLDCSGNLLTSLNVSGLNDLTTLNCSQNQLRSLNVSGLKALISLDCQDNQLVTLNVSGLTALTILNCYLNQLTSVNLTGLTALTTFNCYVNQLMSLNLTGLTALTTLNCYENQLTSLNVSGLIALKTMNCSVNQLASLNISGSIALTTLNCSENQLTSLDVNGLLTLTTLNCFLNQLESLNLSGLTALSELRCGTNQLISLDLRGLQNFKSLNSSGNSLLSCISVDDVAFATTNYIKDATTSFSSSCPSPYTFIPDANFEQALFDQGIDTINGDHKVLNIAITSINDLYISNNNIADLTGIQGFGSLQTLHCDGNVLTSLNVSGLTSLKVLNCSNNLFTSLDVSGLTSIQELNCSYNQLTNLDVSGFTSLKEINCSNNLLTNLYGNGLTSLKALDCSTNHLATMDISGARLERLNCTDNQLTNLNVSGLTYLQELACSQNQLTNLNVSGLTYLLKLACSQNQLTSINLSSLTSLNQIDCSDNQLTNIDLSGQWGLAYLFCQNNQLTNLNLNGLMRLYELDCSGNQLLNLDVSGRVNLGYLICNNNQITNLNMSGLTILRRLDCSNNQLSSLDFRGLTNLITVNSSFNPSLSCISVNDVNFATSNYLKDARTSFSTNCFGNSTVSYCTGAIATPLFVNSSADIPVKWYTVATGGTTSLIAPTPSTTTVGTVNYYFSRVIDGIEGERVTITAIVNALPNKPGSIRGTSAQGTLVGTATLVTYSIYPVAGATSYEWSAPSGVTIVGPTNGTSVTIHFLNVSEGIGAIGNLSVKSVNASGCSSTPQTFALTKILPAATWNIVITDLTLLNPYSGLPARVTSFGEYMGTDKVLTLTATPNPSATSYVWELPDGVNQLSGGTSNKITVNFLGVTSANTFSYETTATVPVLTHILQIGVKSRNGVGVSITNNAKAINPSTTSTAKLLLLKAVLPTAPSIRMTNEAVSKITIVFDVSKFIGTTTEFTLTASVVKSASSYEWILPEGVNVTYGNPASDRIIKINFAGVASGLTTLYIQARSKNGIGSSNALFMNRYAPAPYNTSTYKLMRLTARLPTTISRLTGQSVWVCGGSTYSYSMTASLFASSYIIEGPRGSTVVSASSPTNTLNVLATSDLTFSVTYPNGFVGNTFLVPQTIVISSVNGVGTSSTKKSFPISTAVAPLGSVTSSSGTTSFTRCVNQTFTIPTVLGATDYVWTPANGTVIVRGQGTATIEVDFSAVSGTIVSTILTVAAKNACNVSSVKSINLTSAACPNARKKATLSSALFSIYPNPASNNIFVETTNNSKIEKVVITDLLGKIIFEGKPEKNQINLEQLASGTYVLQAFSGEERFTSKFIKE